MTIQEGPAHWKDAIMKKEYPFEEKVEQYLEPEEGSVVNKVGRRAYQ